MHTRDYIYLGGVTEAKKKTLALLGGNGYSREGKLQRRNLNDVPFASMRKAETETIAPERPCANPRQCSFFVRVAEKSVGMPVSRMVN